MKIKELLRFQTFDVCKLNADKNGYKHLYSFIPSLKHAFLLAQYAMNHDRNNCKELIFIFPGSNHGVKEGHELYKYAEKLAEKYREEE